MTLLKNFWVKYKTLQFKLKEKIGLKQAKNLLQHDQILVSKVKKANRLPSWKQLKYAGKLLSKTEYIIVRLALGIAGIAILAILLNTYWLNSSLIPAYGGSYTEGLVGTVQYINPLYAQANDVDADISALVYSGLLKYENGDLVNDLAQNYEISDDQLTYTFKLKDNILWHDNEKVTADDVIFTFSRIHDAKAKSPLYFSFQGSSVEKIDDLTVKFTLASPFAPFLESLTVGILPEHIWQNIQPENMLLAEYNLKPVGCGPYQFKSLLKNKSGIIKSYSLQSSKNYAEKRAYLDEINLKFFDTFEQAVSALNNKNVEGISFLPKEIRARIINNRNLNFHVLQLPQYTAVFFNYAKNPILKDVKIRKLLSHGVNKDKIANEILNAEVQVIDSPILQGALGFTNDFAKYPFNPDYVKQELEKALWNLSDYEVEVKDEKGEVVSREKDPFQVRQNKGKFLEFTLTTVNQPENIEIAKELQKEWQQIGVKLNLSIIEPGKIAETIKNRDYEMFLYGQILGRDPDPYPFWHSSQTVFPGLNLTSLQNNDIDKLLDSARKTSDAPARAAKYSQFQKLLANEVPAIFLFNPTYTYPQNKKIKGFNISRILTPSNRLGEIASWFIKTDREWK